ncbi:MAG: hypothetical protein GKR89_19880 [Candidatus Latescibacteria bacterium]|nr:hypothetical protein [Candidatus Latescibacterota bacterium]
MNGPVPVTLLGAGRQGLAHLQAIQKLPALGQVIAGMDPSPQARQRLRDEFGVGAAHAELAPALEGAAAAVISVPNHLHTEYALAAFERGLHVFVEKPMALTLEDVDRMIEAGRERGLLLMSGQTLRFVPYLRLVKQLLDDGAVGRVRRVVHRRMGSSRGGDEHSWFARQALSGGILPGIGVHSLDAILWWLGEEARRVYAVVQNVDPHPDIDIEDDVALVATTTSGALVEASMSFHYKGGTDWLVIGEEGVIQVDGRGQVLVDGQKQEVPQQVALAGEASIQEEFLGAIRQQRPLAQASGAEIRGVMALIFAAQESGRTGQAVEL